MDDLETKPEGNKTDNGDVNPDEDDDDDDDDDKAEEEDNVDDGILFYVNKDGLPMRHDTWQRMWSHAARLYPDAAKTINTIRNTAPEGEVPVALPPSFSQHTSLPEKLELIQKYISDLQYNHTGTQFFEIRKNRPITGLMDSAKEMIREALPIKCLEAVILATYLTNGMTSLDRFPVSFRTVFGGHEHRHVVLGVHFNGYYGALGMSRRDDLMYKPLTFRSLSDLVLDYVVAYNKYWHDVRKVKIGSKIPHDPHSFVSIEWTQCSLNVMKISRTQLCRDLNRYAREIRSPMAPMKMTEKWPTHLRKGMAYSDAVVRAKEDVKLLSKRAKNTSNKLTPQKEQIPDSLKPNSNTPNVDVRSIYVAASAKLKRCRSTPIKGRKKHSGKRIVSKGSPSTQGSRDVSGTTGETDAGNSDKPDTANCDKSDTANCDKPDSANSVKPVNANCDKPDGAKSVKPVNANCDKDTQETNNTLPNIAAARFQIRV